MAWKSTINYMGTIYLTIKMNSDSMDSIRKNIDGEGFRNDRQESAADSFNEDRLRAAQG